MGAEDLLKYFLAEFKFYISVCLVKFGSKHAKKYDYIILTGTTDLIKCISYHIFGKSSKHFHQKYYNNIADFMR